MLSPFKPLLLWSDADGLYIVPHSSSDAECNVTTTHWNGQQDVVQTDEAEWVWNWFDDFEDYKTLRPIATTLASAVTPEGHFLSLISKLKNDPDLKKNLETARTILQFGTGHEQYYGPTVKPLLDAVSLLFKADDNVKDVNFSKFSREHDVSDFRTCFTSFIEDYCKGNLNAQQMNLCDSLPSVDLNEDFDSRSQLEQWYDVFDWYDTYYSFSKGKAHGERWEVIQKKAADDELAISKIHQFEPADFESRLLLEMAYIDIDKKARTEAILINLDFLSAKRSHTPESVKKYRNLYEHWVQPLYLAPADVQNASDETKKRYENRRAAFCRAPVAYTVDNTKMTMGLRGLYQEIFDGYINNTPRHSLRSKFRSASTICDREAQEVKAMRSRFDMFVYDYILRKKVDEKAYTDINGNALNVLKLADNLNELLWFVSGVYNILEIRPPAENVDIKSMTIECDGAEPYELKNFRRASPFHDGFTADIFHTDEPSTTTGV